MLYVASVYLLGYLLCCAVFLRRSRGLDWRGKLSMCVLLSVGWITFVSMALIAWADRQPGD